MKLGEWTGAEIESSIGRTPPESVDWTPVDVPGRVERFAGADAVAYRTTFSDQRSGSDERAILFLEGAYADLTVYHNGRRIGEHDAYFVPARFEIEPADENEIVVVCETPDDRFGGVFDTDLVPDSVAVPGIWWDAGVETHPASFLADLRVRPRPADAVVEVRAVVDAGTSVDDHLTFSIRPEGMRGGGGTMERAPVEAVAGERVTVEHELELREPNAWWPRGYGPQSRYVISARFNGESRSVETGLSTVDYDGDAIRVNGQEVRLRGMNVLPGADPETVVERAAAANANLLRVHAHVPPSDLYAACDEHGLLVWQDLPLTGPGGYDIGRATDLAERLVDGCDHHPSVGIYGVHDDPRTVVDDPLGSGRVARYRLKWRAWRTDYNARPAERVAEAFPNGRAVFPVTGPIGTAPDAATVYPGWEYGDATDVEWLLNRFDLPSVVAEFGAGALGSGDDPDEVTATQREQAGTVKTVAEALRRREAPAIAIYALQDPAEAADSRAIERGSRRYDAGLGLLASDGATKAAYGAITDAYQPVVPVLDGPPAPGAVGTTVLNDSVEAIDGTLIWEAGDESGEEPVTVDALDRASAGSVTVPADANAVELTLTVGEHTVTNTYHL